MVLVLVQGGGGVAAQWNLALQGEGWHTEECGMHGAQRRVRGGGAARMRCRGGRGHALGMHPKSGCAIRCRFGMQSTWSGEGTSLHHCHVTCASNLEFCTLCHFRNFWVGLFRKSSTKIGPVGKASNLYQRVGKFFYNQPNMMAQTWLVKG